MSIQNGKLTWQIPNDKTHSVLINNLVSVFLETRDLRTGAKGSENITEWVTVENKSSSTSYEYDTANGGTLLYGLLNSHSYFEYKLLLSLHDGMVVRSKSSTYKAMGDINKIALKQLKEYYADFSVSWKGGESVTRETVLNIFKEFNLTVGSYSFLYSSGELLNEPPKDKDDGVVTRAIWLASGGKQLVLRVPMVYFPETTIKEVSLQYKTRGDEAYSGSVQAKVSIETKYILPTISVEIVHERDEERRENLVVEATFKNESTEAGTDIKRYMQDFIGLSVLRRMSGDEYATIVELPVVYTRQMSENIVGVSWAEGQIDQPTKEVKVRYTIDGSMVNDGSLEMKMKASITSLFEKAVEIESPVTTPEEFLLKLPQHDNFAWDCRDIITSGRAAL